MLQHRRPLLTVLILSLVLLIGWAAQAQEERPLSEFCPALVEQAMERMAENCTGLERNMACYGYDAVQSTFNTEVAPDYFAHPADTAELVNLRTIETSPLNVEAGQWGIAVMNVQANVPDTLPGQTVTFILMGDARIENLVEPDAARQDDDAELVRVHTGRNVPIYRRPSETSEVLGVTGRDTGLIADAISDDGMWARVTMGRVAGWIDVAQVYGDVYLDDLPLLSELAPSPMQAFYFSTGYGQPVCNQAPSAITIRSPDNMSVNLTVNGAEISVGSLITLQQHDDDEFEIIVHHGEVVTTTGQSVTTGQSITAQVNRETQAVVTWSEAREIAPEDSVIEQIAAEVEEVVAEIAPEATDEAPDLDVAGPELTDTPDDEGGPEATETPTPEATATQPRPTVSAPEATEETGEATERPSSGQGEVTPAATPEPTATETQPDPEATPPPGEAQSSTPTAPAPEAPTPTPGAESTANNP
jgi:hypothetical protein